MKGLQNLSLKQLQAVAAIARCGTMTRAARELHITPAALTARMKKLEAEAGFILFDRSSNGLRITDAGREILSAIDNIKEILDGCAERLNAAKGLSGGRVTIGIVSTAKYFAPRVIAAFAKEHPAIEIRIAVGNRENTVRLLRNYDVDLAIMGRPPRDFIVEADSFGKHPFVIIAPPDHPLTRNSRIQRKDLANESFLVREEGSGTRNVFEQFIGEIAAKRPQFSVEVGSNETIKQAVMAGLGIALISAHTVSAEVQSKRISILNVKGLPIWRQWFAVRRNDKALGPAAKAFWNFIVGEGERWLPKHSSRTMGDNN